MLVLGMHFGHDASLCVLRDGRVAAFLSKERTQRIKHAMGLDARDVAQVLERAGVGAGEVDFCAVTSTQDLEYLFFDPAALSFEVGGPLAREVPSPLYDRLCATGGLERTLRGGRRQLAGIYASGDPHFYRRLFAQYDGVDVEALAHVPSIEDFSFAPEWAAPRSLADIARTRVDGLARDAEFARGFHLPVTVRLDGRAVPGALFSHHYAHAAYAFYESGFAEAAVLSHDGGSPRRGYRSGMFYLGRGDALHPLAPHHLSLGSVYYQVAVALGLGELGGEGKLMGLAAYGQPRFFSREWEGNWYDAPRVGEAKGGACWLEHMLCAAGEAGYDMAPFADAARVTEPVNVDVAASTQRLFEEGMLRAVEALRSALDASGLDTPRLCLTGGAALNCPANTRIAAQGGFAEVFAPPGCDDSGLSVGAARALYHAVLAQPRASAEADGGAYLGARFGDDEIRAALARAGGTVVAEEVDDPAADAARLLSRNAVIGWMQGRSEIGPRALGHRSILANPAHGDNWRRVNRIKHREQWRPLAPAVLAEHAAAWFRGAPLPSPYMLFTAEVRNGGIPAVTHVDGTARIQTVGPRAGAFHALVSEFHRLSGVPVVLNTSLNGPGEPIVESPDDALRNLAATELDALYVERFRVRRAGSA
ncbi:MAG TPA: carbamoyltransferase C-terminal domain-containing protein [Longimicrobium sp.]